MNLRHAAPLGSAVCSGLLWVTVTAAPALAQPDEEPATAETPATEQASSDAIATEASQDEAPKPEPAAETEVSASASLGTTASVETTAKSDAKSAKPKPAASAATPPSGNPDEEQEPADTSQISLASFEVLPPGAYPEPKVRGIPGGSLSLDMQGWQWPYLPKQAGGPATRVGFSGSVWVDTAWRRGETKLPKEAVVTRWIQQGRGVLRTTSQPRCCGIQWS